MNCLKRQFRFRRRRHARSRHLCLLLAGLSSAQTRAASRNRFSPAVVTWGACEACSKCEFAWTYHGFCRGRFAVEKVLPPRRRSLAPNPWEEIDGRLWFRPPQDRPQSLDIAVIVTISRGRNDTVDGFNIPAHRLRVKSEPNTAKSRDERHQN